MAKKREYLSFAEAREYVRSLKLKNMNDWWTYCKSEQKRNDIPSHPESIYKEEWKGYGDWLGTETIATKNRKFLSFEEAREYVRSLKLSNGGEWRKYCKSGRKPANIPSSPWTAYRSEWRGIHDWLGMDTVALKSRRYLSFEEAREYVRGLKLKSLAGYKACWRSGQMRSDIPASPNTVYKSEWQGYGDWLGTGTIATQKREYLSFEEAKEFVRGLKLESWQEWHAYCKSGQRPNNIPFGPNTVYKFEWEGMKDWLGTETIAPKKREYSKKREYLSFEEAREHAQSLRLRSATEWLKYCKSGQKPDSIPSWPYKVYKEEWQGYDDWLGYSVRMIYS